MRGSNQRRIKSEITAKISGDDDEDVGSSARTRPLSFDEIMLQRKNRKVVEYSNDEKAEMGKISSKDGTRYDGGYSVLDKSNSQSKDTVCNDVNTKTDDARTEGGPRKEDKTHKRESDNAKSKSKDLHGLEAVPKFEQKIEKYIHHKTLEKNGKDIHHRSIEKMEKVVHHRTLEIIEKDTHHRSSEKLEKDVHHRSNEKSEKHVHHRSSEKVEKVSRRQSNEKMEKDISYRSSHKTERDTSRKSKQNSEKDLGYKSHTGDRDYERNNLHERGRNNSEYDYEKKNHRDHPTSKNRNIDRDAVPSDREYKRKDRSGDDFQHVNKHVVKKHDSGKRLVAEVSERKEKMDSSNARHEEARSKRRRSKSLEHNKDRGRRSTSPRARKYASSRGDELTDKDRSGKHQADDDRSKVPNGSGSLYHRHGGSSSGLGGYSPRKRKTEAAVRTPSPAKRSPEKRSAAWDRNLSGTGSTPISTVPSSTQIFVQAKPPVMVESAGVFLGNSNALITLSSLPFSNLSAAKNASVDSIQLTQATRPLRRLYVDNVPPSASEKDIMEWFDKFLLSSGANHVKGNKPCISCMIHKEKGQALVEFLTPEAASTALAFDGRSFSGSSLNIRRPKDFVELANDFPERSKAGADTLVDIVKDSPHKIFVGGISDTLSSEMLLEILRAFGPLKGFHFEINQNLREPCAFLEYVDQSVTLKACAALNGMKLGGRVLTVAQAFPDASYLETYGAFPSYEIPQHVKTLLERPTEVLKIKNAVDPLSVKLLSESELEEIFEDVRQECTRFGSVISINMAKTVDAAIPETEEKDVGASSPTSKEMEIVGQTSKLELESCPNVDERSTLEMVSPCNIGEKAGVSITESTRNPKEELEDVVFEEFRKVDSMMEPIKSEDEEAATNHTTMTLVGDNAENKVVTVDSVETLGEKTSQETATDVKLELCEDEVSDSVKEGTHPMPEDLSKTNGELQEKEAPVSNSVPSSEVNAKELSEIDEKENADNVFEPGCIFVEFRRPEASCMAAHCLHGRLFDGRTVAIEYVPHHLYRARFPK